MKNGQAKESPKRSDVIIPDYDYLFNLDQTSKKPKKKGLRFR